MHLLLISGPIAAGKTSVAEALTTTQGFRPIRSSEHLRKVALMRGFADPSRTYLQELGDELDQATGYRWLLQQVVEPQIGAASERKWLIDCVRKAEQVRLLKERYGSAALHVHFYANERALRERFLRRAAVSGVSGAEEAYHRVIAHENEVSARSLMDIADVRIDLSDKSATEAADRVLLAVREFRA